MAPGALKRRADCGEKNNECDYENRDGDWQSHFRFTELLWAAWFSRERVGGARTLGACSGRLGLPRRGVYFFMEDGEVRSDSGTGPRIVRVGTHALTEGSGTKLWSRLSQHRGPTKSGGGNHRGSIFRLIVGTSVMARNGLIFQAGVVATMHLPTCAQVRALSNAK